MPSFIFSGTAPAVFLVVCTLTTMNVEHEINLLIEEIRRLGTKNADGKMSVKFGVLFADEKCANLFEALVGTLKAAKRRKIVTYPGELLLQVLYCKFTMGDGKRKMQDFLKSKGHGVFLPLVNDLTYILA
ncbi:costars family protein ABRACL isoform B [Alligator mississippiensis]|uniref:Costars family protein ABRACL n=1 Tax=Alligator mississippiensis TaxID=8496 RepID=A0A151M3K0_ALLMI|nr:costars family protein ABRACL isoform B [Alligator mississippiensis]